MEPYPLDEAPRWEPWELHVAQFLAQLDYGLAPDQAMPAAVNMLIGLLRSQMLPDLGRLQEQLQGAEAKMQLASLPISVVTRRPGAYALNPADGQMHSRVVGFFFTDQSGTALEKLGDRVPDSIENIRLLREETGFYAHPSYLLN